MTLAKARAELKRTGLLLEQDRERPCLVSLVAGEPIAGSWWGHAKGHEIFAILTRLSEDPDVVFTKLIDGKVTLVARPLWPALAAVATSGEGWQRSGLSPDAQRLLERIRAEGPLSSDQLARDTPTRRRLAAAARELETRLLVRSEQVHTESGAHARVLDTWERWADRERLGELPATSEARSTIERAAALLETSPAALPWGRDQREPDVRVRAGVTGSRRAGRRTTAPRRRAGS